MGRKLENIGMENGSDPKKIVFILRDAGGSVTVAEL